MTAAELQTVRGKIYTQYLAWIDAGCPQSYSVSANGTTKMKTLVDHEFWTKQLSSLDGQIAAANGTGGMFSAAQFRNPE